MMSDAQRIETLEIKVAHLERNMQELSDVLYRQQRALDQAVLQARTLAEQLQRVAEQLPEPGAPEHEIPPHY